MSLLYLYRSSEGGYLLGRRFDFLFDDDHSNLEEVSVSPGSTLLIQKDGSPRMGTPHHFYNYQHQTSVGFGHSVSPQLPTTINSEMTPMTEDCKETASNALEEENPYAGTSYDSMPSKHKPGNIINELLSKCSTRNSMKVVVCMGDWNESLNSRSTNRVVVDTLLDCNVEQIYTLPMSCGGRGWLDAFRSIYHQNYELYYFDVRSPYSDKIMIQIPILYSRQHSVAVIESDKVIGGHLRDDNSPLSGNSFGLGQLIREVVELGVKRIYIGVGGTTACADGGIGMAQALGVKFYDASGTELPNDINVCSSVRSMNFDMIDPSLGEVKIVVGYESPHTLIGEMGVARTIVTESSLINDIETAFGGVSEVVAQKCGNETSCVLEGSGCGGGVGFMLSVLLGSDLLPGFYVISQEGRLDNHIANADLLITGAENLNLKALSDIPVQISRLARRFQTKTFVFTTRSFSETNDAPEIGISCIVPLADPDINQDALKQLKTNPQMPLKRQVARCVKLLRLGKEVKL